MDTITIWPIIIATITSFVIGSVWYSPLLFGTEWIQLNKLTDATMGGAGRMTRLYIVQLILSFITFCVIAFAISINGVATSSTGAFVGLLAWVGFVFPIHAASYIWERRPLKIILISSINLLLTFIVGGAIIGAW